MRDQHHIHVEDFDSRAHEERVCDRRLFPFENEDMHEGCEESRKTCGYAARHACILAYTEIRSHNVTLNTADQAGNDAGHRIEEQACAHRTQVTNIEQHVAVVNGEVGRHYGEYAVEKAYRDLKIRRDLPVLKISPYQKCQYDVYQRNC